MKNERKCNPFLRSFTVLCMLVFLTAVMAVGLFYFIFSIPEPEGLSPASWPGRFTDDFSVWMKYENEKLIVEQTGLDRLEEYGLWLQVVDEAGREIYSYQKPDVYPDHYPASRLLELGMSPWDGRYTVFASSLQGSEDVCCYMIGFPHRKACALLQRRKNFPTAAGGKDNCAFCRRVPGAVVSWLRHMVFQEILRYHKRYSKNIAPVL